jgi:K(+)-stimulated pyrophosphate-energized sodium pump
MILTFALLLPLLSLVGLVLAYVSYRLLGSPEAGDEAASDAAEVRETAFVFLRRGGLVLLLFSLAAMAAIGHWLTVGTAACFAAGAAVATVALLVSVLIAGRCTASVLSAPAQPGHPGALERAFRGGTACGLLAGSLALLLLTLGYALALRGVLEPAELAGLIMGAVAVSLFARLAGGVFSKAAHLASHLIRRLEPGVVRNGRCDPASIADQAGPQVGNLCSAVAELSELYITAVIATVLIASSGLSSIVNITSENRTSYMSLPVIIAGLGFAASLLGLFSRYLMPAWEAAASFRLCHLTGASLLLLGSFLVVNAMEIELGVFYALLLGVISTLIVGLLTEWYSSGPPVRRIAQASRAGSVTAILAGLTVGMQSTVLPVLTISGAILIAYNYAGVYGIGMAALGMFSTMSAMLAIASFGPVVDSAAGMATLRQDRIRETELMRLQVVGDTTGAIGKSIVLAATGLSGLALLSVYARMVGLPSLDLIHPTVIVGFFLGGVLPFFLSDGIITSIGKATYSALEESRRQFDRRAGLRDGTELPEYQVFARRLTWASLREIILPLFVGVISPIAIGQILGRATLGGMLAGALLTGLLLGFFMVQSGSAWSVTRRNVMLEAPIPRSSEQNAAVVTGELVGDPFKDACGPSVAVLIRLVAITTLVIAPLLA